MCTAATYKTNGFYFGRTLDNEFAYGEQIAVAPRGFRFALRSGEALNSHYAMIGMAHISDGFPLFYDGMNEKGLCMAGLNFVGNAVYEKPLDDGMHNIAQFELIPWILGKCESVAQAEKLLYNTRVTNVAFNDKMPPAQLHWLIADKTGAITVECVSGGMKIYDNPYGVLTNNPPFPMQLEAMQEYSSLSAEEPQFSGERLSFSKGLGAMGLPGDWSSQSRFARAAFVRNHSVSGVSEEESVTQFFKILGSVEWPKGCCKLDGGMFEATLYTSCCSADTGIYYYSFYGNRQISAVDMSKENLDGRELSLFRPVLGQQIFRHNNG